MLTGDFDKAEKVPRQLLEKNPKQWEAHFVLGNLSPRCRSLRTLRRRTGNWRPMVNLATLFLEGTSATQYAEALKLLEQAATIEPSDWRIAYNQALAFTRLKQADRALELVRRIQKQAPADHPMGAEARKLESNLLEAAR